MDSRFLFQAVCFAQKRSRRKSERSGVQKKILLLDTFLRQKIVGLCQDKMIHNRTKSLGNCHFYLASFSTIICAANTTCGLSHWQAQRSNDLDTMKPHRCKQSEWRTGNSRLSKLCEQTSMSHQLFNGYVTFIIPSTNWLPAALPKNSSHH